MKGVAPLRLCAAGALALVFPAVVQAHSNGVLIADCASGLAHPWLGWDHLIATTAVGFWAAQLSGRSRWLVPAAFAGVMACGAAAGAMGAILPGAEPMIVLSVVIFGLLVAGVLRAGLRVNLGLVGVFALFHGGAHGAEMPLSAGVPAYLAGLVIATAALHASGFLLGRMAQRSANWMPRLVGATCVAAGLLLLIA